MLLVSGERGRAALEGLMRECGFSAVRAAGSGGEARRLLAEGGFELVLVNTPLPDEFGSALALETARESDAGVALLVNARRRTRFPPRWRTSASSSWKSRFPADALPVAAAGARLPPPDARPPAGECPPQRKLEELRLVSRAKGALMRVLGMTEPQAHHYIEKQAMDLRATRREVARRILGACDE
ncbi:MAG: ANTAR domain-containing response regulator [Anaerotruncus massiliensis (ex Togo et al. 2019)]